MQACSDEVHMKNESKITLTEQSIIRINDTLSRTEKYFDSIDKRFDNVDKHFEKVDRQFEKLDKHFDNVRQEIKETRSLTWSHFRWMMGTLLAISGAFITALIKGHVS